MKITFTPQRSDRFLVISKMGDVLTINGDSFDFSELAEGESIDAPTPNIAGPVTRIDGQIVLTIPAPYGADEESPDEATITADDGLVEAPRRAPMTWMATREMIAAKASAETADAESVATAVRATRKAELLELLRSDDPDIRAALASMAQLEVNEDRASQKEMLNTDPVGK